MKITHEELGVWQGTFEIVLDCLLTDLLSDGPGRVRVVWEGPHEDHVFEGVLIEAGLGLPLRFEDGTAIESEQVKEVELL